MNIQIIGLGVVGTAQAYLAQKLGHKTFGYDPNVKEHPYCDVNSDYTIDTDINFICTPESVVEQTIENLINTGNNGLTAIKSTVPLGHTEKISERFGIHVCHNPEFLRESHSLEDVMNPSRIVIGECCANHGDLLRKFYGDMNANIYTTNTKTSELIKLVSNTFRAVTITFWNEIGLLCNIKDIDVNKVAEICNPSRLIGEWEGGKWGTRYFNEPYSGKCLPKDIRHTISAFRGAGLNPKIFEATEEFNNDLLTKDIK